MGIFKNIADRWKSLSNTNKSIAIVLISSFFLASYFFYRWATQIEYSPLFTNMQIESAGKVAEVLKSMNVQYRLSDGGKTILVPEDQVYDLRLSLASEGLFSEGGAGFELFDETSLGITDFERHLNYQRALQEELRRTIVQLEAVEQARVHLVLPEKSVFVDNKGNASASIVVKLNPLASLRAEQVRGIVELVANSVEDLKPEDVTIIDMEGNILNENLLANQAGLSNLTIQQSELKREFEKNLEDGINRLMERIYGPGKVVAMVTAELDFNQKEVTRIIWGNEGVVASEQVIQKMESKGENITLPVGEGNRDDDSAFEAALQDEDITGLENETIRNYEINKTEEKEIYAPGRLLSLSTAVAVDKTLEIAEEEKIREMVAAAIGFNAARGDQINIMGMEFDKTRLNQIQEEMAQIEAEQKKKEQMKNIINWVEKGVGIILAFVLGLILIRTLGNIFRNPGIQTPTPVSKVEEELKKTPSKSPTTDKEERVQEIAESQPDLAAQVISKWLQEGRGE